MKAKFRGAISIGLAALTIARSRPAGAYNFTTHSRIAELAIRAMGAGVDPGPAPQGEADQFAAYVAALRAAPAKLSLLYTGLPSSTQVGNLGIIPFNGADRSYPFGHGGGSCELLPGEAHDLNKLSEFRIQDFLYFPNQTAEPCGLTVPASDAQTLEGQNPEKRSMEKLMGWHAGMVDNHVDDTVLWFRPTLVGIYGLIFEAASLVFEFGVGAILVPFVCLFEAVFGDGCDVDDSFELTRKFNPVDYIQGAIPGIGDVRSDMFTGLWHFEDVSALVNRFNDTRGMWYPGAGPDYPGAMDVVIMASSQISGLSLNALASDGDNNYGQYDRVGRGFPAWQAHTIGVLEWSPLHNLARYGWQRFLDDGANNASGLGWPLHAIGDACAPQHVVGSSSWGHRPYEEFVEHSQPMFLTDTNLDPTGASAQLTRAIQAGYRWWKQFHGNEDMAALIHALAVDTRTDVALHGDWPYLDLDSVVWQASNDDGEKQFGGHVFPQHVPDVQRLLEKSIGAAIAVLSEAGTKIPNNPRQAIDCPSGQTFSVSSNPVTGDTTAECTSTPTAHPPPVDPSEAGVGQVAPPISTCNNGACQVVADCPMGSPFLCINGCCIPDIPR